jgi:ABC-type multidrug transport system ATPase subunit
MSSPVVAVHNLRKAYGQKVAVADVSFDVAAGESFDVLGPNGSGSTVAWTAVLTPSAVKLFKWR